MGNQAQQIGLPTTSEGGDGEDGEMRTKRMLTLCEAGGMPENLFRQFVQQLIEVLFHSHRGTPIKSKKMTKSSQSTSSRGKVRAKATTHLGVSVGRWQGRVYCRSPRLCAMPFSKRTGRLGTSLITPLPCREMHGVRLMEDPEGRNRRIEMVKRHPNSGSQRRPPNAPTRESAAPGGRKEGLPEGAVMGKICQILQTSDCLKDSEVRCVASGC